MSMETASEFSRIWLLPGDSEMARRMRKFDWSKTGLGPVEHWSQPLRTSVSTCLECAFPFVLWWGPEHVTIYNDEYRSVLGEKHPAALGDRASNVWPEMWPVIGPMLAQVMRQGKSTRSRELFLHTTRHGYVEERYYSFSCGPIFNENGDVGGVFCPVTDTTEKVIGERRIRTLRHLAARCRGAHTEAAVCRAAADVLAANQYDVPFALIYHTERAHQVAHLAATAGIEPGTVASPTLVPLNGDGAGIWSLAAVARSGKVAVIDDPSTTFGTLPTGAWTDPARSAIVIPVSTPGQDLPHAILVAAVNPRRSLDRDYHTFFELVATQIASGLAHARTPAATAHRERRPVVHRFAAELAGMARLQEVSTRLVREGDTTSLLEEIVDAAIAITAADMGNIQLFDRQRESLRLVASRGFERPFLEFFDEVKGAASACGAAMPQGERVVIGDVTASPTFTGTEALQVLLDARVRAMQSTPLRDRAGTLVGMLSTHYHVPRRPGKRDLHVLDLLARQAADWIERTRAEVALGRSEERFRRFFEHGLIGMAITSPTKGCLAVNDRLCDILGYRRGELLALNWTDITHPDDVAVDVAQFDRVMAGESDGYSLDKRWIRKDGNVIDSVTSVAPVRRADGSVEYFTALLQDVTQRRRAIEALRVSEERYRSLISQVREYAIFATDERGVVTTWNEGCQQVLGYTQNELVGLAFAELFTPEDRADSVPGSELRAAADHGRARHYRWMLAKDGRRFFAMGATTARRDANGALIGFSAVTQDMTQMKQSQDELAQHGRSLERLVTERTEELEKTTERLRLSERMASIGTLAAGLGHDIGNLLLPLDIRVALLRQASLTPELRELVGGIHTCAQYLQRLSNGLRLLAVDPWGNQTAVPTDLREWWDDVGMMLKNVLPQGVLLEHELPRHECWVAIGRVALTQAVFNLVQNAADAMRDRREGHVSVRAALDPVGGDLVLRVTDDGPGMTEEVRRRCTEPYFSTKTRYVSTGMGLAFVHGLLQAAGGRVAVESELGSGTTITLTIPLATMQRHGRADAPRVAIVNMKNARLRSFIGGQLRTLGFEVHRYVSHDVEPAAIVLDAEALARSVHEMCHGAHLIVVGEVSPTRAPASAVVLGENPAPEAIRGALRDLAGMADGARAH
jgi:PAS domain S-box-containing protein